MGALPPRDVVLFAVFVGVVGCCVFVLSGLNTKFAFDDNFAILNNKDVTDNTQPLSNLLKHDFWGQQIDKPDSHKSFRPLTTLTFRINHSLTGLNELWFHVVNIAIHSCVCILVVVIWWLLWCAPKQLNTTVQQTTASTKNTHSFCVGVLVAGVLFAVHPVHVEAVTGLVGRAEGLCAVFFCFGFILYHTSILLSASQVCAPNLRNMPPATAQKVTSVPLPQLQLLKAGGKAVYLTGSTTNIHFTKPETHALAVELAKFLCSCDATVLVWGGNNIEANSFTYLLQLLPALVPSLSAYFVLPQCTNQSQHSFLSPLPVFTLAVAAKHQARLSEVEVLSAVGCDTFVSFGDSSNLPQNGKAIPQGSKIHTFTFPTQQPLQLPENVPVPTNHLASVDTNQNESWKVQVALLFSCMLCYVCATLSKETGFMVLGLMFVDEIIHLHLHIAPQHVVIPPVSFWMKWPLLRLLVVICCGFAYLWARTLITVTFTLHNYRFLENPIAYTTGLERILSTAHLHAFYAHFLIWPHPSCADWSFDAIPLVKTIWDVRNLRSVGVYVLVFAILIFSTRPRNSSGASLFRLSSWKDGIRSPATALCVLWGLLSFFPASNILFPVGTMVAERLLYIPSIPFCLLVGRAVHCFAENTSGKPGLWPIRQGVLGVVFCWLLVFFWLTDASNRVWENEETLFLHAHKHCGGSAKVHQNTGILWRRHDKYNLALDEFNEALRILPTYCDVNWMRGLTTYELVIREHGTPQQKELVKKGMFAGAAPVHLNDAYLDDFDVAVRCKYAAAQGSAVMENIVHTLLNSPTHKDNTTVQYYAGNLMFAHAHFDQATEHWAIATASESNQLPLEKVVIIRQQAEEVVKHIDNGCKCRELACPKPDQDCTVWAKAAALVFAGKPADAVDLLKRHLVFLEPPPPELIRTTPTKLAARISKLLYQPSILLSANLMVACLEMMVTLDPARPDYALALVSQLVALNKITEAVNHLIQLLSKTTKRDTLRQHVVAVRSLALKEGLRYDVERLDKALKQPSPKPANKPSKVTGRPSASKSSESSQQAKHVKHGLWEETSDPVFDNNWEDSDM